MPHSATSATFRSHSFSSSTSARNFRVTGVAADFDGFPNPRRSLSFEISCRFLFPRSRQHFSDFVFLQDKVTLIILIDEIFHIFQAINARFFINLLSLLPLQAAFLTQTLRGISD